MGRGQLTVDKGNGALDKLERCADGALTESEEGLEEC